MPNRKKITIANFLAKDNHIPYSLLKDKDSHLFDALAYSVGYGWLDFDYLNTNSDSDKNKSCYHVWKEYVGFTEKYWYCEKCDNKSEEDPNIKIKF